ncbi:hypothetical protein [Paenibacillus planticolens]|uniref:Immunity protein 53 of polymorphic toxin system n=1 Tax=Paenibacillus planticolens TaxID=2654976 RepID=A0ABX1ZQ71_9BACL|nr:hypothetical protein [Paenibacillus planticolens]NOV01175.1 hypothetical protein [Paenibacillus planticolens]
MAPDEIELFFSWKYDDELGFDPLVCIELTNSQTLIAYIHDWNDPLEKDYIYIQEEDDSSGRLPINIIKSINWLNNLSLLN